MDHDTKLQLVQCAARVLCHLWDDGDDDTHQAMLDELSTVLRDGDGSIYDARDVAEAIALIAETIGV